MAAASLAVRDDWRLEAGVSPEAIVSLLALSGIYDFAEQMRAGVLPPRDDAYEAVEPIRNIRRLPTLSLIAFGTNELNRRNMDGGIFARNGRAFAEQLRNAGGAVEELELPDATHRDPVLLLGHGDDRLARFIDRCCEVEVGRA